LLHKGLKKITVGRMLRFARQVFEIAVSKKYIAENPMAGLKHNFREGKAAPREYICPNRIEEILRVMPGPWKLMTALARYAGLRSPSEALLLRWSDVHLEAKCPYLHVTSPKTESQGKAWRDVPISPRLAEILGEGKPADTQPSDFVVDLPAYRKPRKGGWHGVNTRQQFNKILVKAGIGIIKNAFKVFRSSCVTDWAKDHAVHVVAAWAGHTVGVAGKHYLTLTDSDWVKATSSVIDVSSGLESTVSSISQAGQVVAVSSPENPENIGPQSPGK
jgi:integrase